MELRQRLVVACLWVAVAGVMALSLEPTVPSSTNEFVRVGVIVLALALAGLYLLDPKNLISQHPFRQFDD